MLVDAVVRVLVWCASPLALTGARQSLTLDFLRLGMVAVDDVESEDMEPKHPFTLESGCGLRKGGTY